MLEFTDEKVKELARGEWFWSGINDTQYKVALRAVDLLADDAKVLCHCLRLWRYYLTPPRSSDAAAAAKHAEIRPRVDRAVAAAERILAASPGVDTADLRVLAFWADHIRTHDLLAGTPDDVAIEDANRRLDAMLEMLRRPQLENEHERCDLWFRKEVQARLRSWELVRSGPPYPEELVERLRGYANEWHGCLYEPIEPLARDATFRAYAEEVLAERTRNRSHPGPTRFGGLIRKLAEDGASAEAIEGHLIAAIWLCGIDQATFLQLAMEAIEHRPELLPRLLSLGFDCDAPDHRGDTLLLAAVAADKAEAVRLLVAAGANPKLAAGPKGKKQTPKKLALARKRKAVIAALDGTSATAGTDDKAAAKLAGSLRAAAKRVEDKDTRFIASCFNVRNVDVPAIVEHALARNPSAPEAILDDARDVFVVDRFVLARVLCEAGYRANQKLRGTTVLDTDLTVAGDLIVDGALIDENGSASVVVAGNLTVHALVTESECIVGGDLRARDFVWGDGSDGTLAVAGSVTAPVLVMTDHTYEHAGKQAVKRALEDPDDDEITAVFAPGVLDDDSVDRDMVIGALRSKRPVLKTAGRKAANAPAKRSPVKKSLAKKSPAKKSPAKKPRAKQTARKR